jgi:hypothetical protein
MRERAVRPRTPRWLLLGAVLACLSVGIPLASAAPTEVSRDSYREAAEPICQANTAANERILAGVRTQVKQGKLAPAAASFARAATELRKTVGELKALPRPPADTARLSKWLGDLEVEAGLFRQIATLLKAGKKGPAEHLVAKLNSNAAKANDVVIPFEFHYCRLEPARFT